MAIYARIYGPCMRISMAAAMAMYAHIYGSSNGHVCAYLWEQQWPCMRISMAAAMAMYAHIYGPCMRISMGHECAYLWGHVYAYIYSSSNGHVNK